MGSSLTHNLKVSPLPTYEQQGERAKYDLFCMWSLGSMGSNLTHSQSSNLFPHGG